MLSDWINNNQSKNKKVGFNVQIISDHFHQYLQLLLQNIYFLYQRCGRFKFDIFFSLGKLRIQILSVDSVANTHSISQRAPVPKKKTNHYLLMKETVRLNHLASPFHVDFQSLPQCVQEIPVQWFKSIQKFQNNQAVQNNIHCWIDTTQIKIEERPLRKCYNTRDLSIRSF